MVFWDLISTLTCYFTCHRAGSQLKIWPKVRQIFLGQPLSRLSAGSIQWNWKQTRFVLDIISYYHIPRHSVPCVTLFEINKRDVSEGSTFKKFNHTLVEFSDNGMYQKVQPLKSSTIHWLNFLITGYIRRFNLKPLKSSTSSEDELAIPIGNKVTWMVLKLLQKHLRFQGK